MSWLVIAAVVWLVLAVAAALLFGQAISHADQHATGERARVGSSGSSRRRWHRRPRRSREGPEAPVLGDDTAVPQVEPRLYVVQPQDSPPQPTASR